MSLENLNKIIIDNAVVYHGSNLDVLPFMADNSVDSIVTDPPYELGFMGKKWDSSGIAYSVELWSECLRVLKPGGHLLAFGGSRTWHRLVVAIEDAGFDVRDSIAWLYGSGFPKSHNIQKATNNKKWTGWGTALKPAFEPVVVARKPLVGTVAENVLAWGVGGLNIDATRIGTEERTNQPAGNKAGSNGVYKFSNADVDAFNGTDASVVSGRWPANIILDEYTAGLLDEQSEDVSRFFYVSKANKRDRNEGLDGLEIKQTVGGGGGIGDYLDDVNSASGKYGSEKAPAQNFHPTVKPTDLMRYLIKLVTPAGGIVLDPFTGSGSTGKAALLDGYRFIGVELTEEYLPIIEGRLQWAVDKVSKDKKDAELKAKEALF